MDDSILESPPREADSLSNDANLATKDSVGSSNQPSHYEEVVFRQLEEMRALNEKHSHVISLLQHRFNTPVDISTNASALKNDVRDGWKRLYTPPRLHRDSADGLLLKVLPTRTHFIRLNVTTKSSRKDSGESIANQREVLQERLHEAAQPFESLIEILYTPLITNGLLFNNRRKSSGCSPVVFTNGKQIKTPEECVSSRNWDFLLTRKHQQPHT